MSRRAFWIGAAILSILSVIDAWIVRYLPTNDGPQAILASHIENHYADPGTIYARILVPSPQFAYKGFDALYAPLENMLGWRDALRVAITIIVLAVAWSFAAVVLALEPKRRAMAYLGFPLAWMWPLYMGFFSFVVGTAIGFAALALVLRKDAFGWREAGVVGVVLLVAGVSHVFMAVLAWCVIAAVVAVRAPRAERIAQIVRVTVAGAPAIALLGITALVHDAWKNPAYSEPLSDRLRILPRVLEPGSLARACVAAAIVLAALAFAARRVREAGAKDRALLACGAAMLLLGVLAPRDITNWQYFSPRFLPLGAMLVLAATPIERIARGRVVAGGAFAIACASLVVTASLHRHLAANCGDALAGLDAPIVRKGMNLPLVFDPFCGGSADAVDQELPYVAPLFHVGALYAVAEGGATPYLFVGSTSAHAFKPRPGGLEAPVPDTKVFRPIFASAEFHDDAAFRRRIVTELLAAGAHTESVIVTGATDGDRAMLDAFGFATDWTRGDFVDAHFDGCTFDVAMPAASEGIPVRVEAGFAGAPLRTTAVEAVLAGDRVHVTRGPCGTAWVRVRAIPKRTDGARVETTCTNATDGVIDATIARTGSVVPCLALRD
jgi:hypothetical protein